MVGRGGFEDLEVGLEVLIHLHDRGHVAAPAPPQRPTAVTGVPGVPVPERVQKRAPRIEEGRGLAAQQEAGLAARGRRAGRR